MSKKISWLDEYKPKEIADFPIDSNKISKIKKFILESKPVILSGPSGSGKTSLVYVLAKEIGYEVLELNASDERSKASVENLLGPASKEASLLSSGRLILIDDVEALSGTKDRGGILSLISFLNDSRWPIVMTTNDINNQKMNNLRKKCCLIELEPVSNASIFGILKNICKKENILYKEEDLKKLSRKSAGDLRAAITDLQSLNKDGMIAGLDDLDSREKVDDILNVLRVILKGDSINDTIGSIENSNVDLDDALLWLDENLPMEYLKKNDLYKAYESLSRSDLFNGRIRKRQYWRFLFYRNFFMTAGVALAKDERYISYTSYKRSVRLLKLFWARQKDFKKRVIAKKIAEKTHCSIDKVLKEVLPYVQVVYRNGNEIDDLNLNDEEKDWLKKR